MIETSICFIGIFNLCRSSACGLWQFVNQGIDARARGRQSGLERVTLLHGRGQLLLQQRIRAPQFFVAKQQTLDAFGHFINSGHGRSPSAKAGYSGISKGIVFLVAGAAFTMPAVGAYGEVPRRSETGSRFRTALPPQRSTVKLMGLRPLCFAHVLCHWVLP